MKLLLIARLGIKLIWGQARARLGKLWSEGEQLSPSAHRPLRVSAKTALVRRGGAVKPDLSNSDPDVWLCSNIQPAAQTRTHTHAHTCISTEGRIMDSEDCGRCCDFDSGL